MKKLIFFLSAFALLGLASCTEPQEVNPNYDPDTREVNADFVFNIATNNAPETKMTAANVQANVNASNLFRGIDNGKLLAYTLGTAGGVVANGANPDKVYDLPTLVPAQSLTGSGAEANKDKSRRVLELSIPTGTNAFMFYGKAIKNGTHMEQGYVKYSLNTGTLSNSEFSLVPILTEPLNPTNNPAAEFGEIENLISFVLTKIINFSASVTVGNTTKTLNWKDFAKYDGTQGAGQKWSVATVSPFLGGNNSLSPLGEILGKNFASFVNIRSGAVRAGSGQSVARMVGDIVVAVGSAAKAEATSVAEQSSQKFAKELVLAISKYFKVYDGSTALLDDLSNLQLDADAVDWLDFTNVIAQAGRDGYNQSSTDIHDGHLRHFPTEFGLPMGAAQLLVNDDPNITSDNPDGLKMYYAPTNINPFNGQTSATDVNKITYPAELCYFGNSPLRVSNETCVKTDYPDGSGNADGEWLNDNSWAAKAFSARGGTVASSTRSVAMADNVNYGTALLGITIAYSNTISNTVDDPNGMYDNAVALNPGQPKNKQFFSNATDDFRLTGVLVGGQYKTVDWHYIAKTGNDNKDFIIYDEITDPVGGSNYISVRGASTPANIQNYTLVWDNYNSTIADDSPQDAVYVALEFVNNTGTDFWGEKNIIRKGGTFYIVGKLVLPPTPNVKFPTDPDFYALPPYDNNGNTKKIARVFMQDYLTVANFTLGPQSLQKAYVTVPDLRSSQMSLGLSVDLKWRSGLSFEVILGNY